MSVPVHRRPIHLTLGATRCSPDQSIWNVSTGAPSSLSLNTWCHKMLYSCITQLILFAFTSTAWNCQVTRMEAVTAMLLQIIKLRDVTLCTTFLTVWIVHSLSLPYSYFTSLLATMLLHVWATGQVGYNRMINKLEGSDRRHMSNNIMIIHLQPFNSFHFRYPVTEWRLELVTL